MYLPAEIADGNGAEIAIHRAWPRPDGRLIVEGRELETGRIRAGSIDAHRHTSVRAFGEDHALPGLMPAAATGELLVHRLKRRAVVRSGNQYRKFIASGKATRVAEAHRSAAAGLAGTELLVPDVISSDAQSVTLTAVPGMSLHDLGKRAGLQHAVSAPPEGCAENTCPENAALSRWNSAWELWARSWPQFVGATAELATAPYTVEDEVQTVGRWTELAVTFDALGVPEDRLRSVSASVARSLLSGASPAGLAHRDLHDKQLLVDPVECSLGIIDCDTLAAAEPALDLANLSVHLEFRRVQGLLSTEAAALGRQWIREVSDSLHVPDSRFEAYAAATALRLACIYAFRPPYRTLARAWFDEVEAAVNSRSPLGAGVP